MRLEGRIWKDKKTKYWVVHIPLLDISTQGKSRKQALSMIEDAVEVEANRPGFKIHSEQEKSEDTFTIRASDPDALMAFVLKRQRLCHGRTVREVAHQMKSNSPTAYAQYEQGKRVPSIGKFMELLRAIDPKLIPILKTN